MKELLNDLSGEFKDKEFRHIYCDEFLNASIATQIKVLREQRGLTQAELAKLAGMKQSRIAALEDIDYSAWSIKTLKRIAEALDLALTVKFDSFGAKLHDIRFYSRPGLERPSFDEDPFFNNTFLKGSLADLTVVPTATEIVSFNETMTSPETLNITSSELDIELLPDYMRPAATALITRDEILSQSSTTTIWFN